MWHYEPRGNGTFAVYVIENGVKKDFLQTGMEEEAERIVKNLNKKEIEEKK